jgi:hypothetical protein
VQKGNIVDWFEEVAPVVVPPTARQKLETVSIILAVVGSKLAAWIYLYIAKDPTWVYVWFAVAIVICCAGCEDDGY